MQSPFCNFIVIDVETGGLPNKTKKAVYDIALTEVAFVTVSSELEIIDQKAWLIKPYKEDLIYDKAAELASNISKQMCIDQGMDLLVAQKEMVSFLKKYKYGSRSPVVLGHNFIKFDADFMLNSFEFCKDDLMKYVSQEPEDTIKWSRLCWQESVNYKLGTCCENAGIQLIDAHRAMTDTLATAKLWIHFQKNLRGQGQTSIKNNEVKSFRNGFEL